MRPRALSLDIGSAVASNPLEALLDLAARDAAASRAGRAGRRSSTPWPQFVEDDCIFSRGSGSLAFTAAWHAIVAATCFSVSSTRPPGRSPPDPGQGAQRRLAHRCRPISAGIADTRTDLPPKSSTSNPSRSRSPICARCTRGAMRRHLEDEGRQQALALQAARASAARDALEQHALVRDVLVDDRQPSSSTARMNVCRNWPSGIIGRRASRSRPGVIVTAAAPAPRRHCRYRSYPRRGALGPTSRGCPAASASGRGTPSEPGSPPRGGSTGRHRS